MKIYKDKLAKYTTFQMGGMARIVELVDEGDVICFFSNLEKHEIDIKNIRILGTGSNVLIGEDIKDLVFVKLLPLPLAPPSRGGELLMSTNALSGMEVLPLREDLGGVDPMESCEFSVGAGTNWDDFVKYTVDKGYRDLSYLSLIPGTVGAAPVQNIGAYGHEVSETIVSVKVYDIQANKLIIIKSEECQFAYRQSVFQNNKHWLILEVTFALRHKNLMSGSPPLGGGFRWGLLPIYPSLKNLIDQNSTAKDIREVVIKVRDSKLPRIPCPPPPEGGVRGGGELIAPSVGSFFYNPVISNELANKLKVLYTDMPLYFYDESHMKVAAGWLIENSEARNIKDKTFHFYKNNYLVITHIIWSNPSLGEGARRAKGVELMNLLAFANQIKEKVKDKFDIDLEIEPEIVV